MNRPYAATLMALILMSALGCQDRAAVLTPKEGRESAVRAYNNDARDHMESKEFGECIEDIEAALSLNAEYSNGYYQRAMCHIGLGRPKKAKNDFIRAAQLGHKKAQDLLTAKGIAW
jgi:tetratricopeptide (TPR) repeat protein